MALVPRMLRPSVLIRRKAMYAGFLGPSRFWKVVGVFVFGRATITKLFGKTPEYIDLASLGAGRHMELTTTKPVSRRQRKKRRREGEEVPTLKERREQAQRWADAEVRRRAS